MSADKEQTGVEQVGEESRRMLVIKRALEVLGWLAALALLAFASLEVFASPPNF